MQETPDTEPARIGLPEDAITAIPVTLPTGAMMLRDVLNVYGKHLLRDAGTTLKDELGGYGSLDDLPTDTDRDAVRKAALIGRIESRVHDDVDPLNDDDTNVPIRSEEEAALVDDALDYGADATRHGEFSLNQFRDWLPDDDGVVKALDRFTSDPDA